MLTNISRPSVVDVQQPFTAGDLFVADTANTVAKLPDVAVGNALLSGGVGSPPAYGKVVMSTAISGILPSVNGGTGIANAGTITNASNTTITGGGTLALGGFTATVPATGTVGVVLKNIIDWKNPVSVTSGTTITSGGVWKVHLCTGTSADYTVNLPDSGMTAGDLIAFQMGDTTTLTKLVTLDATAGNLIDGVQTRVMWSNEVAIIKWDGTNWCKIAGKSVSMSGSMYRSGGDQSIPASTATILLLDTAATNTGGIVTTASNRIDIRRAGDYLLTAQVYMAAAAITNCIGYIQKNGATTLLVSELGSGAGSSAVPKVGPFTITLAAADYLKLFVFQNNALAVNAIGTGLYNTLSASEVLSW